MPLPVNRTTDHDLINRYLDGLDERDAGKATTELDQVRDEMDARGINLGLPR